MQMRPDSRPSLKKQKLHFNDEHASGVFPDASFFVEAAKIMPVTITSRRNELVREYVHLTSSAQYRREQKQIPLEGARLCADAARSGLQPLLLLCTEEASGKYGEYLAPIRACLPDEYILSPSVAQALSDTKSPQGVFCVCAKPAESESLPVPQDGNHILVLENIQDPANLGAVLRTAEAVGIAGVVLAGNGCDAFSPKALRAGMGAAFRLPVYLRDNAADTIRLLNQSGFRTYAAVPDIAAVPVTSVDFSFPAAAVIGNEGNGLTREVIDTCTERVTIPMAGRAESLNAAASAAIFMWEMMRGKGTGDVGGL